MTIGDPYNKIAKMLSFTLTNETSVESGLYRVGTSHTREQQPAFGTTKQISTWSEKIDPAELHQAKTRKEDAERDTQPEK